MTTTVSNALLQRLKPRPPELRKGIVHRIGPWFGPAGTHGLVLLLQNDPQPYVVLRDNQECFTPAGLTREGDAVSFEATPESAVKLSSFKNLSWDVKEGV